MSAELATDKCIFCKLPTDALPLTTPFEVNPCCEECFEVQMESGGRLMGENTVEVES